VDPLGKSPIPLPFLIIGKLSVFFCWLFFFAGLGNIDTFYDAVWSRTIGCVFALGGFLMLVLGFISLGKSVSVGLPREETDLKTRGIYTVTRNPMYVGGFFVCVGSCFYSIHPLNFALCALAGIIHHRVVLKEEQFLENRFGARWSDYARKVPRYIGLTKTSS
jgi:protein-S-isoprenylcysteine O-methyltransferase Ste14